MFRCSTFIAFAFLMLALSLAACGGGSGGGGSTSGGVNVTVNLAEFKFEPATITVTAGQPVNLTLVNKGSIVHTWVVQDLGLKFTAEAGKSVTKTFTAAKAGTYAITCDEPGHKEAGMAGQLVVK